MNYCGLEKLISVEVAMLLVDHLLFSYQLRRTVGMELVLWNYPERVQNYSICLSDVWRNRLILYSIKWLNWDLCLVRVPSFSLKKLLNFHFILLYMEIEFVSNFFKDNCFISLRFNILVSD